MKKGLMECCMSHRGKGVMMLVLGGLILGNVYWFMMSWPVFFGWLLVAAGLLKAIMPQK